MTSIPIDPEDPEDFEETLAVLSDPELVRQIRESEAELGRGEEGATLDDLGADLASRDATA